MSKKQFALLITGCYSIILLIGVWFHQPWLDELQAWLIARESHSLVELYFNTRYEGHTYLWFLILYCVTSFTHAVLVMGVVHAFIMIATTYLIARFSPFKKIEIIMLVFGYYFLFEYGVIARCYSLGILFFFLSIISYERKKWMWLAVSLFLLAQTSAYGMAVAAGWGLYLCLNQLFLKDKIEGRNFYLIGVIILAAITVALCCLVQPADGEFSFNVPHFTTNYLSELFRNAATAMIPIPKLNSIHFWNTNFFTQELITGNNYKWIFVAGVFIITAINLCYKKPAILFISSMFVTLFVFNYFMNLSALRHNGFYFIAFIGGVWLLINQVSTLRFYTLLWFRLLMFIGLCVGIGTFYLQCRYPFCTEPIAGKKINILIQKYKIPMAGMHDYFQTELCTYTHSPFYDLQNHKWEYFMKWDKNSKRYGLSDSLKAEHCMDFAATHPKFIFITWYHEDGLKNFLLSKNYAMQPIDSAVENSITNGYYYFFLIEKGMK